MLLDVRDLLLLSSIPHIGANRLRALFDHFQSLDAIADATPRDLARVTGIDKKIARVVADFFRNGGPEDGRQFVDHQLSRLNKVDGRILTYWDREYPPPLKKIYDPPPFLFVRGSFDADDSHSIAIVGTRSPSPYGIKIAERFAGDFAALGISVISGLARGIDTIAHTATLKGKGRTIAVIGSGIDVIYPPENNHLFDRIVQNGAVVSEYAMGTKPDAGNFPRRNRIISGIALGTIVVETGVEGGAMITASTALDQNRSVFAVPSPLGQKHPSGTNLLIKSGKAMLLETVDDVLLELHSHFKHFLKEREESATAHPPHELTLFEQQIFDILTDDPLHIDLIAERSGYNTSDALVHLLALEFKGVVRQLRGKMFVRA
jgi:DNA processing protein